MLRDEAQRRALAAAWALLASHAAGRRRAVDLARQRQATTPEPRLPTPSPPRRRAAAPTPARPAAGDDGHRLREAHHRWRVHAAGHRQFVAQNQRFAELLAYEDSLIEELDQRLTSLSQLSEAHAAVGGLLRASGDAADLRAIAEYGRDPARTPSPPTPGRGARATGLRTRSSLGAGGGARAHTAASRAAHDARGGDPARAPRAARRSTLGGGGGTALVLAADLYPPRPPWRPVHIG